MVMLCLLSTHENRRKKREKKYVSYRCTPIKFIQPFSGKQSDMIHKTYKNKVEWRIFRDHTPYLLVSTRTIYIPYLPVL